MSAHHLGNIGSIFRFTVTSDGITPTSIAGATLLEVWFKKPTGAVVSKTASLTTDGLDGKMEYISVLGDLDIEGRWCRWAKLTIPSGTFQSTKAFFNVEDNN